MKRYFKIHATTPYCGTDAEEYMEVEDTGDVEQYLDEYTEELRMENAGSFEYLIAGWDNDPEEEDLDNYYADCSGWWEEISKEQYEDRD